MIKKNLDTDTMFLTKTMEINVSIVMQGSVLDQYGCLNQDVVENISIVRKNFLFAEFILSTWVVEKEIEYKLAELADKYSIIIIYNEDPGGIKSSDGVVTSNINRMILSTRNGILAASNNFIIKIRTDSHLYNNSLKFIYPLLLESQVNKRRNQKFTIFNNYVINCNLFARDAKGYLPYLFHPGDICLAGAKEDLNLLFDIPLADTSIFTDVSRACFLSFMKYVPEQYIWVRCIENKLGRTAYSGNNSYDHQVISLSENYYVNNFIALSPSQIGFSWPKHESVYKNKGHYSIYSINDWKALYNKYNRPYFKIDKRKRCIKFVVSICMMIYFFIRTCILKVPLFRKIAIKLFRKRG